MCPHGRPQWCNRRHGPDSEAIGQPLCPDCYDYESQIIWQWWAPELWRRFTIRLRRLLAIDVGVSEPECRKLARVQFGKVAEYQKRGVIHYHGLVRVDGPRTPDERWPAPLVEITGLELADLIQRAAAQVEYDSRADGESFPSLALRFGQQTDVRVIQDSAPVDDCGTGELRAEAAAAYLAKYVTKSCDDLEPGGREVTSPHLHRLRDAIARMADAASQPPAHCDHPARVAPYAQLGRWVETLAYRGHFGTKSQNFSVTLGSLREARRVHRTEAGRSRSALVPTDSTDTGEVDDGQVVASSWHFAGMGWLSNGDAALAADAAARAQERRIAKAARHD